MHIER